MEREKGACGSPATKNPTLHRGREEKDKWKFCCQVSNHTEQWDQRTGSKELSYLCYPYCHAWERELGEGREEKSVPLVPVFPGTENICFLP